MIRSKQKPFFLILICLACVSVMWAKSKSPMNLATDPDFTTLDVNRLQIQVANSGYLFVSDNADYPGMYWPSFASGQGVGCTATVWVSGKSSGAYRTACALGLSEWTPGTILSDGTAGNPYDSQYRIYKVDKSGPMSLDWVEWPVNHGAPWNDENQDGIYNPYSGDSPAILGEQMIWYVANDLSAERHDGLFVTDPVGLECRVQLWGSNRRDLFGDVLFSRIRLIHKGSETLDSCFVGIYVDIEIGDAWDDLVGTDTTQSMMYGYNEGEDDEFGSTSPALGVILLQGALAPSAGGIVRSMGRTVHDAHDLGLYAAQRLSLVSPKEYRDPDTAEECFHLLAGRSKSGGYLENPITGQRSYPGKYAPGDPEANTGWIDGVMETSLDKRVLLSSGPFTFAPQDTQDIILAFMLVEGETPKQSVSLLKDQAYLVHTVYESGFELASTPPAPVPAIRAMDRQILLTWDGLAESYESIDYIHPLPSGEPSAYQFQGYNVYQLETDEGVGESKCIATFDLADGVTDIVDKSYVESLGETVEHTVQSGSDDGVQRYLIASHDFLQDMDLINHRPYYYAVTAYGYNPYGVPKVLESAIDTVLMVMPRAPLGLEYNTEFYDSLTVEHSGTSKGQVSVYVIDPGAITGHDYEVRFEEDSTSGLSWHVADATLDQLVLENQTNQSGNDAYSVVDGLLIKVTGVSPGIDWTTIGFNSAPDFLQSFYYGWGESGERWINGYDLSAVIENTGMGGGLFTATDYLEFSADRYVNIRLDFTLDPGPDSSLWSRAYVIREDLGFVCEQIGWFPGRLWNVNSSVPQQLNLAFVENNTLAPSNYFWDMGWNEELGIFANGCEAGNHEMIWLMDSPYDGGSSLTIANQDWSPGNAQGVMYAIWPVLSNRVTTFFAGGDFSVYIYATQENSEEDIFSFSTRSIAPKQNQDLSKADIQKINVFPNPYLGGQVEERDGLDRFVRFTNLPSQVVIRIFNLTGNLVRKIEHTDGSPYEEWDLRNESNIPVASGMYLVHVDCGDLGEKVLKLAVILSEERLNEF